MLQAIAEWWDMTMELRPVQIGDIQTCGKVMYEAFKDISQRHNFPPPIFPTQRPPKDC